jgi:predicted nucleotidyltransferase
MKERIKAYLNKIQEDKGIEILLACETGSRAWGFPSPDSDFDIRFIYKHKKNWYLSLNEKKDTIELMADNNELDLSGWDLKKSLTLLSKSNPPLLEKIQSPIIYFADNAFLSEITGLAQNHYSKIATMHHYLNMAKKMFEEVDDKKDIKLKKLFYALRTSMACRWILETDEIPPIVFQTMLENLELKTSLKQKIYELIELKSYKNEDYRHTEEVELNAFIKEAINLADSQAKKLPASKAKIEDLNDFFIKMLAN